MTRWVNAALRSGVWLAGSAWWAYLKKPEGASPLAVRPDVLGALGAVLLVAGVALHVWSNLTLARHEARPLDAPTALVAEGPFRYVRNPIYLAGVPILLGIYLLYGRWRTADLVVALVLPLAFHLLVVHREEPALRSRLGSAFDEYCRRVPRWIPSMPGMGR